MTGSRYYGSRSIRPRPLGLDERLPIVTLHRTRGGGREQELEPLDPSLIDFLKQEEAEFERQRQQQKQQEEASRRAKQAAAQPVIHIPAVREVEDYDETNAKAVRPVQRYAELDSTTSAYCRYQDMWVRQTVAQVITEYDADDADQEWLAKFNAKMAKGVKDRASSSHAANGAAPALTVDQLESLMQRLENLHFELLKARANDWGPDIKAGKVPKLPSTEAVLSKATAVSKLVSSEGSSNSWESKEIVEGVYSHWLSRRRQAKGPLLAHLWFEQPWKAVCFADSEDPDEQGDMPFMVEETKNSRGGRIRVNEEDAYELLAGVRGELEALRTLADQVRKRERLKKQLLRNWREQLKLPGRHASSGLQMSLHGRHMASQEAQQLRAGGAAAASEAAEQPQGVAKNSRKGPGTARSTGKGGAVRRRPATSSEEEQAGSSEAEADGEEEEEEGSSEEEHTGRAGRARTKNHIPGGQGRASGTTGHQHQRKGSPSPQPPPRSLRNTESGTAAELALAQSLAAAALLGKKRGAARELQGLRVGTPVVDADELPPELGKFLALTSPVDDDGEAEDQPAQQRGRAGSKQQQGKQSAPAGAGRGGKQGRGVTFKNDEEDEEEQEEDAGSEEEYLPEHEGRAGGSGSKRSSHTARAGSSSRQAAIPVSTTASARARSTAGRAAAGADRGSSISRGPGLAARLLANARAAAPAGVNKASKGRLQQQQQNGKQPKAAANVTTAQPSKSRPSKAQAAEGVDLWEAVPTGPRSPRSPARSWSKHKQVLSHIHNGPAGAAGASRPRTGSKRKAPEPSEEEEEEEEEQQLEARPSGKRQRTTQQQQGQGPRNGERSGAHTSAAAGAGGRATTLWQRLWGGRGGHQGSGSGALPNGPGSSSPPAGRAASQRGGKPASSSAQHQQRGLQEDEEVSEDDGEVELDSDDEEFSPYSTPDKPSGRGGGGRQGSRHTGKKRRREDGSSADEGGTSGGEGDVQPAGTFRTANGKILYGAAAASAARKAAAEAAAASQDPDDASGSEQGSSEDEEEEDQRPRQGKQAAGSGRGTSKAAGKGSSSGGGRGKGKARVGQGGSKGQPPGRSSAATSNTGRGPQQAIGSLLARGAAQRVLDNALRKQQAQAQAQASAATAASAVAKARSPPKIGVRAGGLLGRVPRITRPPAAYRPQSRRSS